MWMLVNWAMLAIATAIAGAAAVAVYWLLLRATLELMRPAASTVVATRNAGAQRNQNLAHATASLQKRHLSTSLQEPRSNSSQNTFQKTRANTLFPVPSSNAPSQERSM
jgi:hypothetical protein